MKITFYPKKKCGRFFTPFSHYLFALLFLTGFFPLQAQNVLAYNNSAQRSFSNHQQKPDADRISLKVKDEKLQTVLQRLEKQIAYVFVYSPDDINASQRITLDIKGMEIAEVMNLIT